jgi:survival-of-motor-neuron-related-splicing factor 30
MADAASTPEQEQEQLAEYESQLADIEQLLQASPEDESLLALKTDLVELVTLTRTSLGIPPPAALPTPPTLPDQEDHQDARVQVAAVSANTAMQAGAAAAASDNEEEEVVAENPNNNLNNSTNNKKKRKKLRDFVLPEHLIPLDTDTEAERNKKRRTAKALKNKYRLKKKEVESENKQKDWQSFQKKTKSGGGGGGSIFATQEGVDDRVGVISKKHMTDFEGRKRHKHE